MFDEMGSFDEAYGRTPESGGPPLRRRKTLKQQIAFWGANAVCMPLVLLCYLTVGAEGLRQSMGIFSMRLYKLPVPGAGLLQRYDGWDRLDLSMIMALILFGAVTFIWVRVFTELMSPGGIGPRRDGNPILFYMLSGLAAVIVLGDCGLFYLGLASQAGGGWGGTPSYVPAAATVLYMAGLALIGAWHADYRCSGTV